jgi:hypothetical protein
VFHKFKKGIFVRIANNKLETFLPFSNAQYKNEFADRIMVSPNWSSVQEFLNYISDLSGYKRQLHLPVDEWIANNALVRYENSKFESDNNVLILHSMFTTLCAQRELPDVEFFINRRDFPQLTLNDTEPYNHMFGNSQKLLSHNYEQYSPILSGSTTKGYADVIFPTFEDWARAVYQESGDVFPNLCRTYPVIEQIPWENKIPKVIFRGATTGVGVTNDTNQRLKALKIGKQYPDLFDVGITSWNLRPRKNQHSIYLQTIERDSYPVANWLSLQEQSEYKYILTLEGHVAAYRLSYELSSGSLILLAKSKWTMWYYAGMGFEAYTHYVPIEEDLSDLVERVQWCVKNDDKCRKIARNARSFYERYLGTAGILNFLQNQLWQISKWTGTYNYLPDLKEWMVNDEQSQMEKELKLVWTNEQFKYDLPEGPGYPRCIGKLDGMMYVMRSKGLSDLKFSKVLFDSVNSKNEVYRVNNFSVLRKHAKNKLKQLENVHENYIGIKSINKLIAKVPNFAYVFGPLKDSNDVYVEYIPSISLLDWINSSSFNVTKLISVMVQINLALSVAQNNVGFIHNDLYPWNIVIQSTPSLSFDYFVEYSLKDNLPTILRNPAMNQQNIMLRIETSIIPIIVDYGKSRSVVFEKDYGLIDHGFVNIFKNNQILDTLTLIYGILKVVHDNENISRADKELLMKLTDFANLIQLPKARDIKRWSKYGALFNITSPEMGYKVASCRPINFINFLYNSFNHQQLPRLINIPKGSFTYITEKGNPILTKYVMKFGNEKRAILEFIYYLNKSTPPIDNNNFFQNTIKNLLARRLNWVSNEIDKNNDYEIKTKWEIIKKMFRYQPPVLTQQVTINFPTPDSIWLDNEIDPTYISKIIDNFARKNVTNSDNDWAQTLSLCVDAFLFDYSTGDARFMHFIQMNAFLYQNAIASNDTLLKLRKLI